MNVYKQNLSHCSFLPHITSIRADRLTDRQQLCYCSNFWVVVISGIMDDWGHHNLICQHNELNKARVIPWFYVYRIATQFEIWKTVFNFVESFHRVWKHTLYRHEYTYTVCQVGLRVLSLVPNHNNLTWGRQQRGVFIQNGCQHSWSSLTDSICYHLINFIQCRANSVQAQRLDSNWLSKEEELAIKEEKTEAVQSFWRRESCSSINTIYIILI